MTQGLWLNDLAFLEESLQNMFNFRFHVANRWTVETTLMEERDATNLQMTFSQTFRRQDSGTISPKTIWCRTSQGKQKIFIPGF